MVEYEAYSRSVGSFLIPDDPKLREFLDDIAGMLLYASYNEVYVPDSLLEKLRHKIKRVFHKDDAVCVQLKNGEV